MDNIVDIVDKDDIVVDWQGWCYDDDVKKITFCLVDVESLNDMNPTVCDIFTVRHSVRQFGGFCRKNKCPVWGGLNLPILQFIIIIFYSNTALMNNAWCNQHVGFLHEMIYENLPLSLSNERVTKTDTVRRVVQLALHKFWVHNSSLRHQIHDLNTCLNDISPHVQDQELKIQHSRTNAKQTWQYLWYVIEFARKTSMFLTSQSACLSRNIYNMRKNDFNTRPEQLDDTVLAFQK